MSQKTAWDLKENEISEILKLEDDPKIPAMTDLGILPGAEISIIRRTVLGGPVYVKINGNLIALRQQEAKLIIVR